MGATTPGRPRLQSRLLGVLLVGRGEVVDGVLHNVMWAHGLLEAAGDALHGGTAACGEESGGARARVGRETLGQSLALLLGQTPPQCSCSLVPS